MARRAAGIGRKRSVQGGQGKPPGGWKPVVPDLGTDFLICPDNTIHQALPHIEPLSPLPWPHIVNAVADEAARRKFVRPGLMGTRWLVGSDVYPDKLGSRGIACVRPNAAERAEMNRIIMEDLGRGVFKPEAVASFQRVMHRMKDEGCDAPHSGPH
jgi:aspartate racemase